MFILTCSGYMAPEYVKHGRFSVKSDIFSFFFETDVFSFGVLVLEIIIGQRNNGVSYGENGMDLLSFVSLSLLIVISFSHPQNCGFYDEHAPKLM